MAVTCPKCKTRLKLADDKAKPEGTRIKCPKCGAVLVYKGKARRETAEKEKAADPAGQAPPAAAPPASAEEPPAEDTSLREEQPAPQVSPFPKKVQPATGTPGRIKIPLPVEEEAKKGLPGKGVMAGSAVGVLILLVAAMFFFRSPASTPTQRPASVPQTTEEAPQQSSPEPPSSEQASPAEVPPAAPPVALPAEENSFASPEEKALAMVKRSDVLLKMTSVETIVNKWTQDNAGKIQIVGWQVKKMDERQYLVSYTGMEGNEPKGFYFVADIESGSVEDLAKRPDLQKQYNIQYSR